MARPYGCYNMGSHMKTTIELSDGLLAEAKRVARREGTTVKALVEQGLRRVVEERRARPKFTLRDASVDGQGIAADVKAGGWDVVSDMIYREHGA